MVCTSVLLSSTSSLFGVQMDMDRAGSGLPKCLHLLYRCYYIGLLQIQWLSLLIKTSNNLHFVYSNLHNCMVTQSSALLLCSDFHQLSSNFDVLTSINTVDAMCAMQWKKETEFKDSCAIMNSLPLTFHLNDCAIYSDCSSFAHNMFQEIC